jgi:sigma-B regulation protein RsbU (phosphoserine phosphatase)
LGRFTLYLVAIELLLSALRWIFRLFGATSVVESLRQWTGFLGFILTILLIFLGLRWFRNHVMWSVRNRLIVTYLFIGGVPIALLLLLALISTYFLAGRFSTYLVDSAFRIQAERLETANASSAQFLAKSGFTATALRELSKRDESVFPGRSVQVLAASAGPQWLKDGFHGLVLDGGRAYLRAANLVANGRERLAVISSVPVDQQFVAAIADDIGKITMYLPKKDAKVNVNVDGQQAHISGDTGIGLSAGSLPPARGRWDQELGYYSIIPLNDWNAVKTGPAAGRSDIVLVGEYRPSALFSRLVQASEERIGDRTIGEIIAIALAILAILFGLFSIVAWVIGIRLTRTLTYSVANLYRATEHINRGDFTHRIKVREKDQLAALQTAFNSMTESVEKLILEQKEKERLQSELEIAHEVQAQLFPQAASGTQTLELHGTCRPARIVSGDYYDFLSYGPEQMGIAVGDISGKGISAALLMATIHSAVRAYEQEQLNPLAASSSRSRTISTAVASPRVARPSPSQMLWLLNRHLYETTQPEKYATLFLGFYDDEDRRLTYSNAGHLPPIILGKDGSTRRLEAGGTVVGLFSDLGYEEQTVQLNSGDLFIAFSDGMVEPENEFGEFGEERLIETIAAQRHLPLERISEHAIAAVEDWIGSSEQPDDVTLVLARRIA